MGCSGGIRIPLHYPPGVTVHTKGLPDVSNLIIFVHHRGTDGLCPTMKSLDHCDLVCQRVVPCANCPATYVGQTGRQLHQRLREHRRAVESGDCANSALAEHAWGCHHPVDWDRVRVLDCHPHLHQRLTLESVHIRSQSKPVNRDLGTMPQIYSPLFN